MKTIPPLVLLLALIGSAACGQPRQPAGIPELGARLQTKPPSSDGSCRFDLADDHEVTVFYLLGSLHEYLGRKIVEESDLIEAMPEEFAVSFRRQLARLIVEQKFDTTIREEHSARGAVEFRSKPVAERLNSCYRYQMTNEAAIDGPNGYVRLTDATLDIRLFMTGRGGAIRGEGLPDEIFRRRRALAYVAGAWSQYRRGENFVFANAKEKATLIAQLLTDLGCHRVSLETTFGYIPATNTVRFAPTNEVREWLAKTF
jgi:hypothetical protein